MAEQKTNRVQPASGGSVRQRTRYRPLRGSRAAIVGGHPAAVAAGAAPRRAGTATSAGGRVATATPRRVRAAVGLAAAPAGVRIRTRIHPTAEEAEALSAIGQLGVAVSR